MKCRVSITLAAFRRRPASPCKKVIVVLFPRSSRARRRSSVAALALAGRRLGSRFMAFPGDLASVSSRPFASPLTRHLIASTWIAVVLNVVVGLDDLVCASPHDIVRGGQLWRLALSLFYVPGALNALIVSFVLYRLAAAWERERGDPARVLLPRRRREHQPRRLRPRGRRRARRPVRALPLVPMRPGDPRGVPRPHHALEPGLRRRERQRPRRVPDPIARVPPAPARVLLRLRRQPARVRRERRDLLRNGQGHLDAIMPGDRTLESIERHACVAPVANARGRLPAPRTPVRGSRIQMAPGPCAGAREEEARAGGARRTPRAASSRTSATARSRVRPEAAGEGRRRAAAADGIGGGGGGPGTRRPAPISGGTCPGRRRRRRRRRFRRTSRGAEGARGAHGVGPSSRRPGVEGEARAGAGAGAGAVRSLGSRPERGARGGRARARLRVSRRSGARGIAGREVRTRSRTRGDGRAGRRGRRARLGEARFGRRTFL